MLEEAVAVMHVAMEHEAVAMHEVVVLLFAIHVLLIGAMQDKAR